MYYVKNLKFEEKPDYNYLKNTFFDLYYKTCFEAKMNWVFDWAVHDDWLIYLIDTIYSLLR